MELLYGDLVEQYADFARDAANESPCFEGWAAGVADDPEAMAWLTNLVWPEQDGRRERLRTAIGVARADPPYLRGGDLLDELPALVERAAPYGPVVVFHSAVIAYLEASHRRGFNELMAGLVVEGRCHWVSNEGRQVLPEVSRTRPGLTDDPMSFVLGVDGRAVARTHGHGRWMTWWGG